MTFVRKRMWKTVLYCSSYTDLDPHMFFTCGYAWLRRLVLRTLRHANLSLVHWDVDALPPRTREQPISTWQRSQIDRFRGRDFSNYFMLSCPLTLFRHVRHLIATNHCLVNWCVFIKTPKKMFRTINLIIKLIKPVNDAKRQNLHITHKSCKIKNFLNFPLENAPKGCSIFESVTYIF